MRIGDGCFEECAAETEAVDVVLEVETCLFLLIVRQVVFSFAEGVVASPVLVFVVCDGGGEGDARRGYGRAVCRVVISKGALDIKTGLVICGMICG